MPAFNSVACIVLTPIIQHFCFWLKDKGVKIRPIAKITIGFVFMALAMLYATIVQNQIYSSGPCYMEPLHCASMLEHVEKTGEKATGNHVNIWMQIPVSFPLCLRGTSSPFSANAICLRSTSSSRPQRSLLKSQLGTTPTPMLQKT